MKIFLTLPFFILATCNFVFAQNKVKVTQQGSSNMATINQSGEKSMDKGQTGDECNGTIRNMAKGENQIIVERANSQDDTLLYSAGKKLNIISDLLYTRELLALQYGNGNGLFVLLPDTKENGSQIKADQIGSQNLISTRATNTADEMTLSQEGSGNTIAINPCDDKNQKVEGDNNAVTIQQKGSDNSASISQN